MVNLRSNQIVLNILLLTQVFSLPLSNNDNEFCSGDGDLYKYETGKEYLYDYETDTTLWINNVSDEAKSSVQLKSTVSVTPLGSCSYLLKLSRTSVSGESLGDSASVASQLNNFNAVFRLNQRGELDSDVKFQSGDNHWSRNVKRGVISAFQLKSEGNLRPLDYLSDSELRSATVYESDILGRCRTTYSLASGSSSSSVKFNKKKSLQRCTLNGNSKTSAVQYVPYKTLPEFFQGRLFIESHECNSVVDGNVLASVVCKETSTYRVGSRGRLGAQAIVKQSLKFRQASPSSASAPENLETLSIQFEYDHTKDNELDSASFNVAQFTQDICDKGVTQGLLTEHSDNFRDLVKSVRSKSAAELTQLYDDSNTRCSLAGLTVSHALIFADTDDAFEVVLSLLDKDAFSEQKYITEYPILTALARNQNPSENLLNKLRSYLGQKSVDFPYLNKLYLIYSALVKTFCTANECSTTQLNNWSSVFASNIADNCANNGKKELVVSSLKAIGNIGYFSDANSVANCATRKENSLEVRVNAIQALRRFSCAQIESLEQNYNLLQDVNEDAEVRINAFLGLVRCSDESVRFKQYAKEKLADFLLNENDVQVLTYIIDYGKEHGLTAVLNTVLNEPRIREKFSVNFKELSWNNYRYRYSVMRDSALEIESSVIYTSKTFVPRSIRFNVTMHMFGMSINFMDVNVRLEGLDEILKAAVIDKLKAEKLLKKIMQQPEQLLDILNLVADKLKYVAEKPLISLSVRVYGADVLYSRLDSADELKKFANVFKGPRENLYRQVLTIRNMLLVDSNVKQPLANGLEFETSVDISSALLVSKASNKEVDEDEIDFNLNNFYSASLSVNRRYDVQFNNANRLSLKKKSVFNGRLRMNIDGTKKNGSATYNLNLLPVENLPLLTLDGRFYKLGANSQYNEVKEFSVEQVNYNGCTSERFETAFGVNLCYSVQRPKASLLEAFKYFKLEDVDQSVNDDDEDEEDESEHDENDGHIHLSRPSLLLSGPYRYQVVLKNPELIKTITLNANLNKESGKKEFNALLTTKSQAGEEKKTLELVYVREKVITNRGLTSKMNFEFRRPSTNEIRFQAYSEFEYVKHEVLAANFFVDNKIGKEFHASLNFGRNKTDSNNIVPSYYLEALINSQVVDSKQYRIFLDVKPTGRNIQADFIVEKSNADTKFQNVKLIDALLSLKTNDESNDSEIDYTLDFHAETARKDLFKVYGTVLATLLHSNIDLKLDYSNPKFQVSKPTQIKFGHLYDGAAGSKSYVEFHVDAPLTPINHGTKLVFTYNLETAKFDYVEVLLSKPGRDTPISVFFERSISVLDDVKTTEVSFGLRNSQLDLSDSESQFAKTLVRVDDQEVLTSLVLHYIRTHNKRDKKISMDLDVKKNENLFVTIQYNLKGNLEVIRKSTTEVPKQEVGGDLFVKLLENSGKLSAEVDFESSVKNNKHKIDFEFKAENLFKMLLKIASIETKLSLENGKLDAKIEVQKVGDVKGFKIESKSNLRTNGNAKEFDVSYEKKFNNQILSGNGVARYTFKDFKNFETSITVNDHYESKMSLETKRSNTNDLFGYHSFKFSNKHLDGVKSEREVNILINNRTESQGNTLFVVASLRRGDLGSLKNKNKLEILFDLNSENTMLRKTDGSRSLVNSVNSFEVKSKRFNIDLVKTIKASHDVKTQVNKAESQTEFKFPAIFTDPGKLNRLSYSYNYSRNVGNNEISFKNTFETDSKLFGKNFRVFNADFNRKVLGAKNVKGNLNLDYKLASDAPSDKLKSIKLTVEHDYVNAKVNLKQNRLPSVRSMFKTGELIDISDCTVNTKYNRKKTASNYLLDAVFNLECQNRRLTSNTIYISRSGRDTDAPSTKVELSSDSGVYYEVKTVSFAHEKFTSQSGLVSYRLIRNKQASFANEFSYKRSLKSNGKLESASYKLNSEVGSAFTKKCELNLESKTDYYNSLNCRLNTTRVPNVELSYGYNLKVENPFDFLSGRRGVDLDVVIPGRALKATYKSNYATPIDGTDDDEDENDEREFNGTATFQWNLLKEPTKLITVNLKRDNYAKGKSLLFVEVPNHPSFNLLRFQVDRERTFEKTVVKTAFIYELKNGNKNRLDSTVQMRSDFDTNSFSLETNLQRPSLNTLYENRYNKNNGRLQYLGIRLGNLIKLSIDKESEPEERRISLQLVNPDETKYSVDGSSKTVDSKYVFEGTLTKGSQKVSTVVSTFDSNNNNFDVRIKGASNNYRFNFGLFNETLANAYVLNENSNIVLGLATLQLVKNEDYNDLVLSLKWNRLWSSIQRDLLGDALESKAQENEKFNSYLGDVYAELSNDLKSSVDSLRKERLAVANDFRNIFYIVLESYSKYVPSHLKNEDRQSEMKAFVELQLANSSDDLPLYKRFFKAYNALAQNLQTVSLNVRKYSKALSRLVPRLPLIEYNKEQITKEFRPFDNNLVVSRPTLYARNLYQFNAEYRDYVKKFGENVLFIKRSLSRNVDGLSTRALINKYKYRSLKDYTLVANVYNKRNIIGFDGEQKTLQSKCRYLLAHETHKNRFSVVLNFNDSPYLISVLVTGQKSVDISYNKAAIDNKPVSLPQTIKTSEDGLITVTKNNVAVCVELNHDLRVCCYEDSNSCTVALTRWFTGKINGLLGMANNNPGDNIKESDWYLEKTCRFPNSQLKKPSLEATKTCHAIFGRHRRALFRHAIMAIRPNGWQKVCETVLTADSKAKCLLLKAFDHHADQEKVTIEAPNECFTCSAGSKQHNIGQSLKGSEAIESGSDYVFLTLPCDKNKFSVDLTNFVSNLKSKNPSNKYYVVSVDEHDASIYQSDSNEVFNFEPRKAYETLSDDATVSVSSENFNKGLFLAASLFSKRIAQNRFLIIRSCGNCLPYSILSTLKYAKKITERNVIVHSWGDYDIKNLENDGSEDIAVGYDEENVFLYKPSEKTIETDTLESYKIEHKADLCQRLAVKTHGSVLNLNYLRTEEVMEKVSEWLEEPAAKFEYKIDKCQKHDTSYGDLMDFSYSRTKIENDE